MKSHGFHEIQEFHDFMKMLNFWDSAFSSRSGSQNACFYLQNKAILRAGRCRCRFHGNLWEFMKFYKIKEKVKMLILQNFHKIHKNAPGPQNHY